MIRKDANRDYFSHKLDPIFTNYAVLNFRKLYNIQDNLSIEEIKHKLRELWIFPEEEYSNDNYHKFKDYNNGKISVKDGIRLYQGFDPNNKNKIYVFGNSNTFGLGNDNSHVFSYYLHQLTNYTVYNYSGSDESIFNIYNRILNLNIESSIVIVNIDTFVYEAGFTNATKVIKLISDSTFGIKDIYYSYICKLIALLRENNNRLLLYRTNKNPLRPNIFRLKTDIEEHIFLDSLRISSEKLDVKAVDIVIPDEYFFDLAHINKYGHRMMASYLYDSIKKEEFIEKCQRPKSEELFFTVQDYFSTDIWNLWKSSKTIKKNMQEYKCYLQNLYSTSERERESKTRGLLLVSCNPLTKGHVYAIKLCSSTFDELYIHLNEGEFFFPLDVRRAMLESVVEGFSNVILLKRNNKIFVNKAIFGLYYYKDELNSIDCSSLDISKYFDRMHSFLFDELISHLHITHLCWGKETNDKITDAANRSIENIICKRGITPFVFDRLENISGTYCRELYLKKDYEELKKYLPESSISILKRYDEGMSN